MKQNEQNIPPLLFIFMLLLFGAAQQLSQRERNVPTPESDFAAAFCTSKDWRDWQKLPPARRQLCGVGIFLNSDSVDALTFLPAIGPKRAKDIVDYRQKYGPFQSLEQLKQIEGIGAATIQKMTPWIEDVEAASPEKRRAPISNGSF